MTKRPALHPLPLLLAALLLAGPASALDAAGPAAEDPADRKAPATADPGLDAIEARLPAELGEMKRVMPAGLRPPADGLAAYYEGPVGRATVTILPAGSGQATGQAVEAQVEPALLSALQQDIRQGAQALGPETWTGEPQGERVEVRDGPKLTCGALARRKGQEESGPDQLHLMNRKCFWVLDGRLAAVFLSTPYRGGQQALLDRVQHQFLGAMALRVSKGEG